MKYTLEQVSKAVNAGADLVQDGLGLTGDRDWDLINLLVNAAIVKLENESADLDDVIRECFEADPEEVRGWWG